MNAKLEWQGLNTIGLFKEFYDRVCLVKRMIMQGFIDWQTISGDDAPADIDERESVKRLSAYLKAELGNQMELVASNTSALEYASYKEACYVMCALADEIFIMQINWFGARYWQEFSLEESIFSTSFAGDDYFRRLAKLINKDVLSELEKKLASVYILSLQLGFRGRFRGKERLIRNLLPQLRAKAGYAATQEVLFPKAYGSVINPAEAKRLEPFSSWHRVVLSGLAVYLLVSSLIWFGLISSFFKKLGA